MEDQPSRTNGFRWPRTGLPILLLVGAVVVALVAVSALIFVLYRETRGPGEILRRFARAVDTGDCPGSYDLLDRSIQQEATEDEWCELLPAVDDMIDSDFTLEEAVLKGDEAVLRITFGQEPGDVIAFEQNWLLRRHGERSWRVLGPGEGLIPQG